MLTKKSDSLKVFEQNHIFCKFCLVLKNQCPSFLKSDVSQIAHQKRATVSKFLTKNEQLWAIRSPKMCEWVNCSFFERIAHSLFFSQKNEQFGKITDEVIPIPRNHNNILSLKPKIDPPYCTKVYATTVYTNLVYNKSACTWRTVTQS